MVTAHLLSPKDVPYVWENVAPLLARVTQHTEGEMEPDDFLEALSLGEMQLWIAVEKYGMLEDSVHTAMVTQIIHYPQKKVLRVIAIAGSNFKELHESFNSMVEAFAIQAGCSSMELWGRKGWKKMLPDWKDTYIVFTKDLKKRMH